MPCNSDYMNPTEMEKNLSTVYGLLDELKNGKLPKDFGSGYDKRIYNKGLTKKDLDKKVKQLCSALQKVDVKKYSLEMQIWWRDHQKADKKRLEEEFKEDVRKSQLNTAKQKAISKLTPKERKLLNL